MPVAYIKSLSSKGHGSIESLEKKWKEAKKSAEKQGKKKNWAYVVGIFKKMAGVKESIHSMENIMKKQIIREGKVIGEMVKKDGKWGIVKEARLDFDGMSEAEKDLRKVSDDFEKLLAKKTNVFVFIQSKDNNISYRNFLLCIRIDSAEKDIASDSYDSMKRQHGIPDAYAVYPFFNQDKSKDFQVLLKTIDKRFKVSAVNQFGFMVSVDMDEFKK